MKLYVFLAAAVLVVLPAKSIAAYFPWTPDPPTVVTTTEKSSLDDDSTMTPGSVTPTAATTENGLEFDCNVFPDGNYAIDPCSSSYIVCRRNRLEKKNCTGTNEVFDEEIGRCNWRSDTLGCIPDIVKTLPNGDDTSMKNVKMSPPFDLTLNGQDYQCELPEVAHSADIPNIQCKPLLANSDDNARVRMPNELNDTYDYIIVGGGTAGCVLASRLSEDSSKTVLLLEAGGEEDDYWFSHIPGFVAKLQLTTFDWQYMTTPQQNCCSALIDNQVRWSRGKGLGGSSTHNFMEFVRGSHLDYDHWANDLNNIGWSYEDVLPYFKKQEHMEIEQLQNRADVHGYDGPIDVNRGWATMLGRMSIEAAQKAGYTFNEDYNANLEGVSSVQFTINKRGFRVSTAKAYLRPAMKRPNLHVAVRALVGRVLFEGNNNTALKAVGVEYLHNGIRYAVKARKEVIITGGAVNSPQLLMLSGIGPKEHLKSLNIPVLLDNPWVGLNLRDQPCSYILYQANASADAENVMNSTVTEDLHEFFLNGTGLLSTSGVQMKIFYRSGLNSRAPIDTTLFMFDPNMATPEMTNLSPEAVLRHNVSSPLQFVVAVHTGTQDVGSIRLQSADPLIHPLIDLQYLSVTDIDLEVLVKGIKVMIDLFKQPQFAKYGVQIAETPTVGCEDFALLSDDYLRCSVRNRLFSLNQQTGSCRMGPKGEKSVVDQELKVHDVERLRIVDSSIIPDIISGETYAITVMIAEKAADMIKKSASKALSPHVY